MDLSLITVWMADGDGSAIWAVVPTHEINGHLRQLAAQHTKQQVMIRASDVIYTKKGLFVSETVKLFDYQKEGYFLGSWRA